MARKTDAEKVKDSKVFSRIAALPAMAQNKIDLAQFNFEINEALMGREYVKAAQGCFQYVVDNIDKLPTNFQKALAAKKLSVYPSFTYFTKQIGGSAVTELIEGSDSRIIGLKSFDKTALDNGTCFVFFRCNVLWSVDSNQATNIFDQVFTNVPVKDLANGEFTLRRADTPVFRSVTESYYNVDFSDERNLLPSLLLFCPDQSITATFGFASANGTNPGKVPTPGNTLFLKTILQGIEIKISGS